MWVQGLPLAVDTDCNHNTDPIIPSPFAAFHSKVDLFPWPSQNPSMDPHVDSSMGLQQRLCLVHQLVSYSSVLDLFQHIVVVAAVEVDLVDEVHLPGTFQIHWIVE